MQLPAGTQIVPSHASSASSVVRATRAASSANPAFQAGCPQQVASEGTSTSKPQRLSTRTAAAPTSGATVSTTQVGNKLTRSAMSDQYGETLMADVAFAYYPVFKRTEALNSVGSAFFTTQARRLEELFEKFSDRVRVRGVYSATGFRPDADLMFWWVADSADDVQELLLEFRRTALGHALELTHAFLGVVRPAEFNPDHLPSFLKGEPPRRYLTVYPFVRTEEWYLMPAEDRGKLLAEHGRMGREFPEVYPNTTAAFGLGDWEWILAFESDDLTRIVDCIRKLREAEARRYTKLDVPFVLGVRKELPEAIADLS